MKLCGKCGQSVAETVDLCPSCGHPVGKGWTRIDGYRIDKILHDGHATILCRAQKVDGGEPVLLRLFKASSNVDEAIARRLTQELEELKKLPGDYFVRHLEIRRSSAGLWYRVSEWIDGQCWGPLLASGRLRDDRTAFRLFRKIAAILDGLHRIGHIIPHLILDDIIVIRGDDDRLDVKIDYKLSRFFDPKMDRPGPMLKRLLACHPDIINQRPVDFRSDIWSLGKIFVEILSGDSQSTNFVETIDRLKLSREIRVLFKVMLADDPDLRPRSMAEVVEALGRFVDEPVATAPGTPDSAAESEMRWMKARMRTMTVLLVILVIAGVGAVLFLQSNHPGREASLEGFANRYAGAMAFLMAEYALVDGQTVVYRNRTEGTAFLVDGNGYLLTNRHVACPWLEDSRLHAIIGAMRQLERSPRLDADLFLWFEGQRAFKRLPGDEEMPAREDAYHTETAYRTGGDPGLEIAGVALPPVKTRQIVKSPLRDDFAVLKIDRVPRGIVPLPVDHGLDPKAIKRLSPVITLGFPLGRQTQAETVNVSVTRGNVRRTFDNLLQVDTSIHRGNSGGPLIDIRGRVIGIASRVAMDWATGPFPVATHLPDIGMILPIAKAAAFYRDLAAGKEKWRGMLDLSVDATLGEIAALAGERRWKDAVALADREVERSPDPRLIMADGVMHLCTGDSDRAAGLFTRALSMNPDNDDPRLMLFIIDRLSGRGAVSPHGQKLIDSDWRHPAEFYGYLARILDGQVDADAALAGGYTAEEKSWLHYVAGLVREERGDFQAASAYLEKAAMLAPWTEWIAYLCLARLETVARELAGSDATRIQTKRQERFFQALEKERGRKEKRRAALAPAFAAMTLAASGPEEKRKALETIFKADPDHGEALAGMAFYTAMTGDWERALMHIRRFLALAGRENDSRLSLGLLEPLVLSLSGRKEAAAAARADFIKRTRSPWYRRIAACLNGDLTPKALGQMAGDCPEFFVTAHTALGLHAEGEGDGEKAVWHYKEALGSYMDDWLEYELAAYRIQRLKNGKKN